MTPSTRSADGTASDARWAPALLQSGRWRHTPIASRFLPLRGPTPPLPRQLGGRLNTARLFFIPLIGQPRKHPINGFTQRQERHSVPLSRPQHRERFSRDVSHPAHALGPFSQGPSVE